MNRCIRTASHVALALGLVLAVAACERRSLPPIGGATPAHSAGMPAQPGLPAAGPVAVALLAPVGSGDGKVAADANAIVNAAKLAAGRDARGSVSLRVYDTGGDPARAAAAARRAASEGARLILGPLFGVTTPAVGSVAAATGLQVISFSTDSSVAGGPVYVSGFLPEVEAERILDFASRQGLGTVGVYAPDTPYGRAALTGAEAAANRAGVYIATRTLYPRSFQDIQDTSGRFAEEALASGVDAILLPDSGDGLKIVGSFMDYNGLAPGEVQYLGLGQWENRATLTEPSLRGGWFAGADPSEVQRFADTYASVYGNSPPFIAVLGYDAVRIAQELIEEARATGAEPFSPQALTRPEGFDGALGPIVFEPDGTARRALAVLEVGAGGFNVLEPAPLTAGAGL